MLHPDDNDAVERERSLLSLGDALRSEPADESSRLARAIADVRAGKDDAAARHRLARSRRSTRETPLLSALRNAPDTPAPQYRPEPEPEEAALPPEAEERPEALAPSGPVDRPSDAAPPLPDPPAGEALDAGRPDEQPPAPPRPDHRQEIAEPAFERRAPERRAAYAVPAQERARDENGGVWNPLIDPGTVVAGVIRSKWIIAATTIAGALLGVLIALSTPKKYESSTELVADPRDLAIGTELTQSGISNEATIAVIENQVRFLTSGTVISKVVERLHLAEDPEFNGQGPATGLKGLLSPVLSLFRAKDGEDDPGRRYALAAMNLGRALSVERGGKTFVISISATTQEPEKSKEIAATMAEVFIQSYGDLQSGNARRAAGELSSKLDELRKGVEAAERKVEAFRSENDLVDAQGRLISDDELLKLNEQLSIARARKMELSARAASTRGVSADAVLTGSLPEDLSSPSMQELRAQYSALRGESDRLAVRLGPRHPQRLALEAQLSGARGLIDAELRRIVASIQTDLKRAVQLEQELNSRLAQLKARQGSLSEKMVTLRELERDATAKRAVYEAYLLRARETGEQEGLNSANINIISPAYLPLESNPPSRSTIALAGMLLGLMAGIGIGGVRGTLESLRDRGRGRAPKLAWKLRRRPVATMFDQDDGLAAGYDTAADTVADRPAELRVEEGLEPPPEPGPSDSQFAYSSETPKDTTMQHPFNMQPPFDPNQPQAPTGYPYASAPGHAQQPMPPAGYAPQQPMQPAGYAGQQQPSGFAPQPPYYPQQPMQQPGGAQPYGYAQPVPPAVYQQPMPGYWQPQFQAAPGPHPYAQPMPAGMYPPPYAPMPQHIQPQQPMTMQQPVSPQTQRPIAESLQNAPAEETPIEEIRASLREFREAIRELAESRSRRRYF
ncbi:Wzz/FepE/Etk N-terminal domain-containing protein [Mesorhizobium sp. ASY16-5R]|uniref:GumC family protein n=1 Tax=Mesorhizobium sp. ASY16-5R TaxID=3445772 RepID=UPI003FA008D6